MKCWKDPGSRWQLHLKIERTSDGIERKAFELEIFKRAPGMFRGLQKVTDWTAWKDRSPLERRNKDQTLWGVDPLRTGRTTY
jgi:hypothetical protein